MGQCSFDFMSGADDRRDVARLSPFEWVRRKFGLSPTPASMLTAETEGQPNLTDLARIMGIPGLAEVRHPPGGWKNSGVGGPGAEAVTFQHREHPSRVVDSSLADVLEPDESVPPHLFLTLRQQVGILSRLAYYGKWDVLRMAIGDPDWRPEGAESDRPEATDGPRSLDLAEIKARLRRSG